MELMPFPTDGTTDREPLFGNTLLWKECQRLYAIRRTERGYTAQCVWEVMYCQISTHFSAPLGHFPTPGEGEGDIPDICLCNDAGMEHSRSTL